MVLKRLEENGITLKSDKFHLILHEIEYVGFVISAAGIFPTKQKLEAIQQEAAPENLGELQSFIGFATFLRHFVPDFAEIMSPLDKLPKKKR